MEHAGRSRRNFLRDLISKQAAIKWLAGVYLLTFLTIGFILFFPAVSTVQAATLLVNTNLDGPSDGACDQPGGGTNDCTLREAIEAANVTGAQDTITFGAAVTGDINLTAALPAISKNLIINGPGAATLTIRRSSGGNYRILATQGTANVTIKNITLANGNITGNGGAIYANSPLTLQNVVLDGNQATQGGGVFLDDTIGTISNTTFKNNSAGAGGGFYLGYRSTVTIDASAFLTNTATGAGEAGGAFHKTDGDIETMSVYINNTTFAGNSAPNGNGGAIFTKEQSGFTIANSTLTGNQAQMGGGIYNDENESNLVLKSTILAENSAIISEPDIRGKIFSGRYNLIKNLSGVIGELDATDLSGISPNLGPLQNNGGPTLTRLPNPGSPVINAGQPGGCFVALNMFQLLETDQRGKSRLAGGRCDIGAAEVEQVGLDLNGPGYGTGFATFFTPGGGAVGLAAPTLLLNGPNATVLSATIKLANQPDGPNEILNATGTGAITANYDNLTGRLTLSGVATLAEYKTAIASVTYNNIAATPSTALRRVEFVVYDSMGATYPVTTELRLIPDPLPFLADPPASSLTPTFVVNSLTDSAGTCPANCTLRAAIAAAETNPGVDTISFAPGISGTLNLTSQLQINSDMNIVGPGAGKLTIQRSPAISDTSYFRIFRLAKITADKPDVLLQGLRLSNGNTVGLDFDENVGGAILGENVNLTLNYLLLDNNVADFNGGAVTVRDGSVITVTNSIFYQNRATGSRDRYHGVGGGLYPDDTRTVINATKFISNTANRGGAVYVNGAAAQVVDFYQSEFSGNTALYQVNSSRGGAIHGGTQGRINFYDSTFTYNTSYRGGGIFTESGVMYVGGSLFAFNEAIEKNNDTGGGGGIYKSDTGTTGKNLYVENSTLTNNKADAPGGKGGGLYGEGQLVRLANVTISHNSATAGGGIFKAQSNGSVFEIRNTIIGNNSAPTAPDMRGDAISKGYNLLSATAGSSGFGAGTNDKLNLSPNLGSLQNNGGPTQSRLLQAGSPAINAANPAGCQNALETGFLTTDQRGFVRPADGRCDMGALEINPNVVSLDLNGAAAGKNFAATYSEDAAPVNLTTADLTLVATNNIVSATVSLASFPDGAAEVLTATNLAGGLSASYNPATGLLTISGASSAANYQAALASVVYSNSSQNPQTSPRSAVFSVHDTVGTGDTATAALTVLAVNDMPVISGPSDATFKEAITGTIQTVAISDADAGGAVLNVTISVTHGTLWFGSSSGLTFDGGIQQGKSLVFSGTLSNLNAALTTLHYRSEAYFAGTELLEVRVNDLGNSGGAAQIGSNTFLLTVLSALVVSSTLDNGDTSEAGAGTLSYAIAHANDPLRSNHVISFLPQVTLIKLAAGVSLPPLPAGVSLQGRCGAAGAEVTLDGNGNNVSEAGLVLNGNNALHGLHIKGFNGKALNVRASNGKNSLSCTRINR